MEGTGVVWEEEAQSLWEAVRAKKPKKKSLVAKEIIAIMFSITLLRPQKPQNLLSHEKNVFVIKCGQAHGKHLVVNCKCIPNMNQILLNIVQRIHGKIRNKMKIHELNIQQIFE